MKSASSGVVRRGRSAWMPGTRVDRAIRLPSCSAHTLLPGPYRPVLGEAKNSGANSPFDAIPRSGT